MSTLVFVDTETGGTGFKHPITQIAAVAVAGGQELGTFETYIRFNEEDCEPEALEVQHYDPAVWIERAVDEKEAMRDFCAFIRKFATVEKTARESGNRYKVARCAGHNAAEFDMPRLRARAKAAGNLFVAADMGVLDTLHLARWYALLKGDYPPNFQLETLCNWFGVTIEGEFHGALADCRATVEIARRMFTDLRKGMDNDTASSGLNREDSAARQSAVRALRDVAEPSGAEVVGGDTA